jgi:predicted nucleotidyltransferase
MTPQELSKIVEQLIPSFRSMLKGKYAISLGGSHAKGYADTNSDIDFYIYTEDMVSFSERKTIIGIIADHDQKTYLDENIEKQIWGGCVDFYYQAHKIETTIRSFDKVNEIVQNCLQGIINIMPTVWTLNGYLDYIYLSELSFIKPLEDPYRIIANWKEQIQPYPDKLKQSIINTFWGKATFWLDNFHYKSAIKRCDIIYTSGIIQQTVHNIIQILFAINETYFLGDKKIEKQLQELIFCPNLLMDNLVFLLSAHRNEKLLNKQREILLEVVSSIDEFMRNS